VSASGAKSKNYDALMKKAVKNILRE